MALCVLRTFVRFEIHSWLSIPEVDSNFLFQCYEGWVFDLDVSPLDLKPAPLPILTQFSFYLILDLLDAFVVESTQ